MAKSISSSSVLKSISFVAVIFIFALLSNPGIVECLLCERASQTWSGSCRITSHCDNQCQKWENALHGACHTRNNKKMCFCYFKKC